MYSDAVEWGFAVGFGVAQKLVSFFPPQLPCVPNVYDYAA